MAQRYNIAVQDIVLTPIGGVARLRGEVANPRHEIRIALAGPYVSLVLALFGWLFSHQAFALGWDFVGATFHILAFLNSMLFAFNLLPSFPMDGGRVLRGVLAQKKGMLEATRIAAGLGKSIAILFIVMGLATQRPNLAIIGVFILWAAGSEYRMMKLKTLQDQMFGNPSSRSSREPDDLDQVDVSPPPYAPPKQSVNSKELNGFWGDIVMTGRDLFNEIFSATTR